MFEVFTDGFSFLNLLSLAAFFTTVGLFFCGIPICRQIWKRKDTAEISGAPFLMGVLGGCCWMTYGYLKKDHTVLVVTGCQVILYSSYTIFYWLMTKDKRVVIRRGATSTLPLPLCVANFLVSSEWFLYGLLVRDVYLITPNGIGSFLALCQLFLFVILPRKPGQRSLMARLCRCCAPREKETDLEAPTKEIIPEANEEEEDNGRHLTRARRWSQKVIANMNTVAEEIEQVIGKASIHHQDQFMYSQTIDDDTASEKTVDTVEVIPAKKLLAALQKGDLVLSPENLAQKLGASLRLDPDAQAAKIRRTASSPDLSE
ncbi:mtN3/saliva family protein [Ancylostoma duodenale]|uniref:Sugar transporter SWEET n=1 Tax=Ancylostoma duodenale TaxID=51022 RepID=A0A0C2H3T4_9BILA|nr:mtN3/saliva family protein [Ancylostoma duodenale]